MKVDEYSLIAELKRLKIQISELEYVNVDDLTRKEYRQQMQQRIDDIEKELGEAK